MKTKCKIIYAACKTLLKIVIYTKYRVTKKKESANPFTSAICTTNYVIKLMKYRLYGAKRLTTTF